MEKRREKKRGKKSRAPLHPCCDCNAVLQFHISTFFFPKRVEKSVQYSSYKIKPSPWVPMALNSPPRPAHPVPSPQLYGTYLKAERLYL